MGKESIDGVTSSHLAGPSQSINVISIKWGRYYTADYVNRLHRAVLRNFKRYSVRFYCFTDDSEGFDEAILVKPLPELKDPRIAYLKEAGLCDDNLGGLQGQRVLYFDLDSVITGDLDCFVDMMTNDEPFITKDYGRNDPTIGGSNIYSWVVGTLGYIKAHYESDTDAVISEFGSASQEYWSSQVIKRYGKLNLFPDEWHISFKKHCLPKWPMNLFVEPKPPEEGVKLVNFHGDPKVHDAQAGVWSTRKNIPWYKRIYKRTKPVSWLDDYWR